MPDDETLDPELEAQETPPDPEPAPEPVAAEWGGVTQQEWQQTQEYLAQIGQALPAIYQMVQGQNAPEPEPGPAAPEYDPFDPASVDQYIEWKLTQQLDSAFQQHLGPFEGLLGSLANERGEAIARQELGGLKERIGDFNDDLAFVIASGIIDRGGDPQSALPQAAQFAYDYEERIRADEREKYKGELNGLSHAPGEQTGGATTTEVETIPTGPKKYEEAVANYLARKSALNPTG